MNKHFLDRPNAPRVVWAVFAALLAGSVVAQLFVAVEPHFAVEGWFAFFAVYGFVACAAMVVVAKVLGILLKRGDGYYGDDRD